MSVDSTNTRIVNVNNSSYDVFIGRPSKFGNPFIIGRDGTRSEVIEKYRHYLDRAIASGFITVEEILALKGERLGCFCAPHRCHGEVIIEKIKELELLQY